MTTPLLGALALALVACGTVAGDPPASVPASAPVEPRAALPGAGPVIVELFTSQGCSSCPPADRALSTLVRDGHVGDRAVVPLAFHVDYWDDLGWADPFSRPAWSQRQYAYATGARVYTPQLVVGGRADVLGSDVPAVRAAITAAPLPARLDAHVRWHDDRATITATAPPGADVWVALYEDELTTRVARGENAGEALRNDHVVRRLERVVTAGASADLDLALDPSWRHLGAVAFAQRPDRAIVATRALDPRP